MTTVFLSGSRQINRLNEAIHDRLAKIVKSGLHVVIGDANGADKAMQSFFAEANYRDVEVFCSGDLCRNNVGRWNVRNIEVSHRLKGRDFYAQKDKAMAEEAEYGLVLWDGKSAGSVGNVLELMQNGKPVVVYFGPQKNFRTLRNIEDFQSLLANCPAADYRALDDKIHVVRRLEGMRLPAQEAFAL
jgi:hypothetical protein